MKKLLAIVLFAVHCSLFTASAQSKEEKQILDLSKKKFEWMIHKQYDSLNAMVDDNIKYVHSNGWVQSKKEMADDFKSGKISLQDVTTEDATVRLYEHTALLDGKGKFKGLMNDKPFELELMYTEVYILKNNKWLLVSRHANRM